MHFRTRPGSSLAWDSLFAPPPKTTKTALILNQHWLHKQCHSWTRTQNSVIPGPGHKNSVPYRSHVPKQCPLPVPCIKTVSFLVPDTKTVSFLVPDTKTVSLTGPGPKTVSLTGPGPKTVSFPGPTAKTVSFPGPTAKTVYFLSHVLKTVSFLSQVLNTVSFVARTPLSALKGLGVLLHGLLVGPEGPGGLKNPDWRCTHPRRHVSNARKCKPVSF